MSTEHVGNWTDDDRQEWERLYGELVEFLRPKGRNSAFWEGDFWIVDDDYGNREQIIHLDNLNLLAEQFISDVQEILASYPEWIIRIGIISPDLNNPWPSMAIIVKRGVIIDQLRREYLPQRFASFRPF